MKNNKKICFFSGDISRSGGTERVSTVIANELNNRGLEVCFLSLANGKNSFFSLNKSIPLYSLEMENKSLMFNYFKIIKKLHNFIKLNQIDYLVDIDIILSLFSIPATKGTKTEVFSWEHFNYYAKTGGLFVNVKRKIARYLISKKSKYLITLTKTDELYYKKNIKGKVKILSIYNPITIKNNQYSSLKNKVVLAVGRLEKQKGFDQLLYAWKKVCEQNDDWILKIIGSGNEKDKLDDIINQLNLSDRVMMIPSTNQINDFFLESSIFVLSSRYEGFGLVLTEAKSFGLPIVSFDVDCGPKEIVFDGKDGFLIEKGNINQLAKKLLTLINNKKLRENMGKNAFADKRFELNNIILQWEKIFK